MGLPGYQTPAADRVQPATVDAAVRAVVDTVLVGRSPARRLDLTNA